MHGDGMAVTVNRHHNIDPSARHVPSICILDGDSQQRESDDEKVFRLPGSSPELYVYDRVVDVLDANKGVLAVSLHRRYEDQHEVADCVRKVRLTNVDPHTLFSQVGKQLGLIAEETVRGAFLSVWAQTGSEQVEQIAGWIRAALPPEPQKKPSRHQRTPGKRDGTAAGQQRLALEDKKQP